MPGQACQGLGLCGRYVRKEGIRAWFWHGRGPAALAILPTLDPEAPDGRSHPIEARTKSQRAARLVRESRQLDEAREDGRAGRVMADEDVDAWLDRLVSGEPLPEDPPSTHAE